MHQQTQTRVAQEAIFAMPSPLDTTNKELAVVPKKALPPQQKKFKLQVHGSINMNKKEFLFQLKFYKSLMAILAILIVASIWWKDITMLLNITNIAIIDFGHLLPVMLSGYLLGIGFSFSYAYYSEIERYETKKYFNNPVTKCFMISILLFIASNVVILYQIMETKELTINIYGLYPVLSLLSISAAMAVLYIKYRFIDV